MYVKDLTSFVVKGVSEINNVLAVGKKNRTVGATLMNQVRRREIRSSRVGILFNPAA